MGHAVTGPFDVSAFAEVLDLTSLSDSALAKIQKMEGVQKTQTAVVVTSDGLGTQQVKLSHLHASHSAKGVGTGDCSVYRAVKSWRFSKQLRLAEERERGS
jgi:hypothetical protein